MSQKSPILKRSACKLTPLPYQLFAQDPQLNTSLLRPLRTPRHDSLRISDLHPQQTQNQCSSRKPLRNRDRLPSLRRVQQSPRDNPLNLEGGLAFELPLVFDSVELTDRTRQVGLTLRTPTLSSKGKSSTTGSSENSFEGNQQSRHQPKNATEFLQAHKSSSRERSSFRNPLPCRIVNSKKLPFDLHPRTLSRRKSQMEEMELDISVIEPKQGDLSLLSSESFQELCLNF